MSILYQGTTVLGTGVDFGKGLGRSEPWGNFCWSGWRLWRQEAWSI